MKNLFPKKKVQERVQKQASALAKDAAKKPEKRRRCTLMVEDMFVVNVRKSL